MAVFKEGQLVSVKSDNTIQGVVVSTIYGFEEVRYRVFINKSEIQEFYESQLQDNKEYDNIEQVSAERFNAELTAAFIRNPSVSSLYSVNSAEIDFIPHQYRPVLKFIKSDRPRLLIADGVGVGKTIETGLILQELEARRNIESVLIICPRPLVAEKKWENEMKRFNEEFKALDGRTFRDCLSETSFFGEWPEKYNKCIIPYSIFDEKSVEGDKRSYF